MLQVELLAQTELVKSKKNWVYERLSKILDLYLVKAPMSKTLIKYFIKYGLDKFIKTEAVTINKTIAKTIKDTVKSATQTGVEIGVATLAENILKTEEPSTNDTVVELASEVLKSNSEGVISIFGKVMKDGDKPKPDIEVGVGIAKKF